MKELGRSNKNTISHLCSLGLFLAGCIFYSSSLIESSYATEFALSSWQIGIAQSAVPLGAIIGAIFAGRLSDLFGRHRLLVWSFLALVIVGFFSSLSFNFSSLCLIRLSNGFLAGTLYPLCAAYLTEMTPHASLARQTAILMFINCLAAPVTCVLAITLSYFCHDHMLWRMIASCHALPAFIAYLWSKKLPESKEWLICNERSMQASNNIKMNWHHVFQGVKLLFNPTYCRITICLMAAWFLMDIAYYGINFFVPYLLQVIQIQTIAANLSTHSSLNNTAIWGTLVINIFFMLGAFAAIFIVEKIDLIKLQKYGFLLSSISLFLLASYFYVGWHQTYLIIFLFVLFNFAINVGPDVTTYLLSATSYPVEIRASGHGLIAGFAKFGSFLGVLFLPRLQDLWGYEVLILLLSILLFTAYLFTIHFSRAALKDRSTLEGEIVYETN